MTIYQILSEKNISFETLEKFFNVEIVPKKLVDMILDKIIMEYPFDSTAEEIYRYILSLLNELYGNEEDWQWLTLN